MSDNPSSPLLGKSSERPTSQHSRHSEISHESTPLLSRSDDTTRYDGSTDREHGRDESPATTSLRSLQNSNSSLRSAKGVRRWPTVTAVAVLGVLAITIILSAFFAPAAVEEYAKEALVIEPTNLSIDSFTEKGVRARIQANFRLDASRVKNKHVRNVGRLGTWIAREIESRESVVQVYLPEYGNLLVGTAKIPRVVVDIRNGHTTNIDFLSDLEPGEIHGIRQVANDWLEGRLDQVRILGKADVELKSGFIPLGTQSIAEYMDFEGGDIPTIPKYNINRLNFREVPVSRDGQRGMAADVSLSFANSFPIKIDVPHLGFDILVPNCDVNDPYIRLAEATTAVIHVEPFSNVAVDVGGVVQELPESLIQTCPHSNRSPLDFLLGDYIHGNDTTIYVKGSSVRDGNTPDWITQIISSVTVPIPFPGHTFDGLIRNFSLTDTKFSLPDPFAAPGSDDADPQISGNIVVIAGLPKEMNFGVDVSRIRANADVSYKGRKLGKLNLHKWQNAQSERLEEKEGGEASIKIQSSIKNAPLNITDQDVFSDVIQAMIFGKKAILLKVEALVDVEVSTVLGKLIIKDLPAEGMVPVKPISTGKGLAGLQPRVGDIRILSTGPTSLKLEAKVNFTNPTEYTAHIPFANIHILNNGSTIGDATARGINVTQGNNTNMVVAATWDPTAFGGKKAVDIAKELLSQYISGWNTTLTFCTHNESIPHQPLLGRALSKFAIEIPTPHLSSPVTPSPDKPTNPEDGDKPHFMDDATFHLLSSTATFTLISPLEHSTIFIERINATAFYNHTEPVGTILYDYQFEVPPGRSQTPKLPVDWSFNSVGYEAMKNALGRTLKLDAEAEVDIRLGQWRQTVWYKGKGIGATVRF